MPPDVPESVGDQNLGRLHFRAELVVFGKEILGYIAPPRAEAPVLDLSGLGGVDREGAGGVQDSLVPHSVTPHVPAQTSVVHIVLMWARMSCGERVQTRGEGGGGVLLGSNRAWFPTVWHLTHDTKLMPIMM